jgi:hypothetical protein
MKRRINKNSTSSARICKQIEGPGITDIIEEEGPTDEIIEG